MPTEPSWPEWGAFPPPEKYFEKDYFTGMQGEMHAGEILDSVCGPDVERHHEQRTYEILRCHPCLAIHAWPLPSEEALARFYTERFYQQEKPDYVERYERDRPWWTACVHMPIIDTCARALALDSDTTQPRVLDIGAGPGIFLDCAKRQRNWDTTGIEPNTALADALTSRGHRGWHGMLGEERTTALWESVATLQPHIVMLYEVLEHQICPETLLLNCHDIMADNGLLVVVVPNDYNPLQFAACAQHALLPYWLAPPQHLWYFTPKCLQLLLRRCGFDILDMRGTYPLEDFLLAGHQYVGNDAVGRACHQQRMQEELADVEGGTWVQREAQYRANMQQRIGREIVAIARKRA